MSNKKTKREKKISDVIKLDPNARTPTKAEFDRQAKNGNAVNNGVEIEKKVFSKKCKTTIYPSFNIKTDNKKGLVSTEDFANQGIYMEATKEFFGNDLDWDNSKRLLYDISCEEYYTGERITGVDEVGKPIYEELQPLYDKWKKFCEFVDNISEYVEINFPDYSHKQLQYQQQLKQSVQLYPDTIIENIYKYLKKYGVNQHKKAKSAYLAKVGLPNINATNAKKIVELFYQKTEIKEI